MIPRERGEHNAWEKAGLAAGILFAATPEQAEAHELRTNEPSAIEARMDDIREHGGLDLEGTFTAGGMRWEVSGAGRAGRNDADETQIGLVFEYKGGAGAQDDVAVYGYWEFGDDLFPAPDAKNYAHVAQGARVAQEWRWGGKDGRDAFQNMLRALGAEAGAKTNALDRGMAGMHLFMMEGLHSVGLNDPSFDAFFHGRFVGEHMKPDKDAPKPKVEWTIHPSFSVEYQPTPHRATGRDDERFSYQSDTPSERGDHYRQLDDEDVVFAVPPEADEAAGNDAAADDKLSVTRLKAEAKAKADTEE